MLKTLAFTGATLLALVAIIVVVGWMLPVAHVATQAATVRGSAPDVFAVIADIDGYDRWWDGYDARVDVVQQRAPHAS